MKGVSASLLDSSRAAWKVERLWRMYIELRKYPCLKGLLNIIILKVLKKTIIQVLILLYLGLIKSFGLKIEALNQEELATKKPLTQEKKKAVPK